MLDPHRVLRWVWLGRVAIGFAILVAAVFVWERAEPVDTLVATLAFATAILATVASAMYGEIYRRPTGRVFFLLQCAVDLLLVTAVVHITGGWSSQFAALYILVIAVAALLLPFRDGVLVAVAASALYAAGRALVPPRGAGARHLGAGGRVRGGVGGERVHRGAPPPGGGRPRRARRAAREGAARGGGHPAQHPERHHHRRRHRRTCSTPIRRPPNCSASSCAAWWDARCLAPSPASRRSWPTCCSARPSTVSAGCAWRASFAVTARRCSWA